MKKYRLILIATAAVLASCEKDVGSPSGGLPMRVDASLAATKASITTADLQEFWLQVDCPADAAYSYFGKVSKSGAAWSPDKQLYWKDETTAVSYTAAFFEGHDFTKAEFTGSVDLDVPADQSTQAGLNAADLLTLNATGTSYEATTDGTLPVVLGHGLTKVNIVLSLGSDFYDNKYGLTDNPVTALAIKGSNLAFNFQPATGAVSIIAGTENDITPMPLDYTPGAAAAKTSTATYEAILVPQTIAAGALTVSFSVGTSNYAWTNSDDITLTAGQTVNLPVSVTAAPPVSPFINGHQYVDMGEVTIGSETKHLLWATCNIGADNPWDYGDYFDWGGLQPYYQAGHSQDNPCSDWIDGKDGYNWKNYTFMQAGKSDSEHITKYTFADGHTSGIWYDGSTFKGDNGDGVEHKDFASYDYADDAARQLWGGNWRIPTDEEWQALLGTDYTWVWTTDYLGSGKNGMLVTRNDDGSGTDPCAGNSIFLPAASYWTNASLGNAGSFGYYWSSSLTTYRSDFARSVNFYSGGKGLGDGGRFFGQPLRPVTD